MSLFGSEDRFVYKGEMVSSRIALKKSDVKGALKTLESEDWTKQVANYYESHYKHIGRWWELLSLQQVTIGLPPIPYGKQKLRSQFHVMLRGPPGTGKSTLVYTIKEVGVNPNELGVVTDAKIAGSIKDGKWVPGEAYKSRDGIMLIPELSETLKEGEHFKNAINHLIQIMEDQRITKSLSQPFEDVEKEKQKFPTVEFWKDGKWEYVTNTCVAVATWEMNEAKLMEKVTAGFYSRIFEIPLNYTKAQLFDDLENVWMTLSGVRNIHTKLNTRKIRSILETMYLSNKGFLADVENTTQLKGTEIQPKLASELIKRYKEMVTQTLEALDLETEGATVLPTLIREPLDGFRIAVADAISRRFAGTMTNGIVKVDRRAIDTACDYLRILVNRRVETYKKLTKYMRLSGVEPELMMSDGYRMINKAGKVGMSLSIFEEICMKQFGVSQKTVKRRVKNLVEKGMVVKVKDPTDTRKIRLISVSKYMQRKHPLVRGKRFFE